MIDFKVYNTNYAVNEYKPFGERIRNVSTSFNRFNKRVSRSFTVVAAVGQIREYSRVELLHSLFN
jgi:hypothetical protein